MDETYASDPSRPDPAALLRGHAAGPGADPTSPGAVAPGGADAGVVDAGVVDGGTVDGADNGSDNGSDVELDRKSGMQAEDGVKRYRSIWLSDIHLGTRGCQADYLLNFLRSHESDYLYLVGDIVDGWRLKKSWFWPQSHNDVVQKILRRARKGTKVFLIPGNHDEAFREFVGLQFGGVTIMEDTVHVTADGRRFLVIHGDQFDAVVRYAKWLAHVGDTAYVLLLGLNTTFNWVRRKLGFPYWSISAYLKHRTKKAVEYIGSYEKALADEARRRQVEGVICGHIHHAEMRDMGGVLYCNDGDWVESCTALVEHDSGELEILNWADTIRQRQVIRVAA